ncbi:septum formation family protein [Microbacterium sp. NPDC057944]|uniref:septum formation family protein n=1 Tax=Microbacterium sp. NPDC057944 TaxID=3346286 RepID=UPI0036D78D91
MKLRTRHALALVGSAAALSFALTGCSALNSILGSGSGDADRDDKTGQVTESSNIGIFALKVGDCKMESPSGLLESADVVPCTEPHDEEVFFEYKMPDGEYDATAIDTASQEQCTGEGFTSFVGIPWDQSALGVYPITPTQDTWDSYNDRVIQCVIFDQDESGNIIQSSASLKGAAR